MQNGQRFLLIGSRDATGCWQIQPASDSGQTLDPAMPPLRSDLSAHSVRALMATLTLLGASLAACEQLLIDRIGAKAFRRPLAADDRTPMKALFDAGIKEKDFATGVEWFLTGLLQAPDFLYLWARPAAGEKPGQVAGIEAHEMASRLAYFVWDSAPDDALLAAADARQLG